jgi:hypothetical protein
MKKPRARFNSIKLKMPSLEKIPRLVTGPNERVELCEAVPPQPHGPQPGGECVRVCECVCVCVVLCCVVLCCVCMCVLCCVLCCGRVDECLFTCKYMYDLCKLTTQHICCPCPHSTTAHTASPQRPPAACARQLRLHPGTQGFELKQKSLARSKKY